jgi:hypothetical protein
VDDCPNKQIGCESFCTNDDSEIGPMKITLFALCLVFSHQAVGSDVPYAKSNVAFEFAECGNYYMITRGALEASLPPGKTREKAIEDSEKLAETAYSVSAKLTDPEIALARIKLSMENMKRKMKGSFEYYSVIAAEYTFSCKDLMEAPNKRFQFWIDKK